MLHGVSFVAEPGQTVALVGPTGGGKTTVINLLLRFYDVDEGSVLVDGVDVRDVTQASLRSRIALVPQDPFLFSGASRTTSATAGWRPPTKRWRRRRRSREPTPSSATWPTATAIRWANGAAI